MPNCCLEGYALSISWGFEERRCCDVGVDWGPNFASHVLRKEEQRRRYHETPRIGSNEQHCSRRMLQTASKPQTRMKSESFKAWVVAANRFALLRKRSS